MPAAESKSQESSGLQLEPWWPVSPHYIQCTIGDCLPIKCWCWCQVPGAGQVARFRDSSIIIYHIHDTSLNQATLRIPRMSGGMAASWLLLSASYYLWWLVAWVSGLELGLLMKVNKVNMMTKLRINVGGCVLAFLHSTQTLDISKVVLKDGNGWRWTIIK